MRHSNWGSIRSATSGRKRKRTIRRATIVLVSCVTNPLLRRGVPVRVVPLVSGQMAIDIWEGGKNLYSYSSTGRLTDTKADVWHGRVSVASRSNRLRQAFKRLLYQTHMMEHGGVGSRSIARDNCVDDLFVFIVRAGNASLSSKLRSAKGRNSPS